MKTIPSIKTRLLVWLTIPLLIGSIILFIFIYLLVHNKVNKHFDSVLYATGKSMQDSVIVENGIVNIDLPYFAIDLLASNSDGLVFYSVVDEKDRVLVGYKNLLKKELLKEEESVFYNTVYAGANLRAVSFKTSLYSAGKTYSSIITIAESTEGRESTINEILIILFILVTLVVLFTIMISLLAVKNGLQPLYFLKNLIQKRDSKDLTPIKFNTPKEIEDVVNSINILLKRSRENITYIEQFNSDVSHQLRTPLAEIQVKIEQYYNKEDKEYVELNRLVNSMKHIIEQLLLYAKTNPNTINIKRFKKMNLNDVCRNYAFKIAPKIYAKGFEFAFEGLKEEVLINIDDIMIESMINNIINNSLFYAVDKNNKPIGTITISLKKDANSVFLNIKDEGSGLNQKDLDNIFDRFYRVDTNKIGIGLGLSIVKQIAQLHNATVQASNDNGLLISIRFNL